MNKFLFTDGIMGVKEARSQEELLKLIESAPDKDAVRIWVSPANEWIGYEAFRKKFPDLENKQLPATITVQDGQSERSPNSFRLIKRAIFFIIIIIAGLLVYNFTKTRWNKSKPVLIEAVQPGNVPLMDMDSLITLLEFQRGQKIDKNTKSNLRLRNTWPERILLKAEASSQNSNAGTRFTGIDITIDNTTGHLVDEAVVELSVWKNNKKVDSDTLKFVNLRYDNLSVRSLPGTFKGDSISISFETIKARAFNFCYSASVKNNSGNYNDRWFCREQ